MSKTLHTREQLVQRLVALLVEADAALTACGSREAELLPLINSGR